MKRIKVLKDLNAREIATLAPILAADPLDRYISKTILYAHCPGSG